MARTIGARLLSSADTARVQISVAKDLREYEPDDAPLIVVLSSLGKETCTSSEVNWWDYAPETVWTKINYGAGYAGGEVSLVVDDDTMFSAKDIVMCPRTGEAMYISAVDRSTHALTVTRGWGDVSTASLVDDDWMMKLPNTMEEFSSVPEANTIEPVKGTNYVQEIRLPFSGSWKAEKSVYRTSGTPRAEATLKKTKEFRRTLERAVIGGRPKSSSTHPTMGGLMSFIPAANKIAVDSTNSGLLTESYLNTLSKDIFQYGSRKKLFVGCPTSLTAFSEFGNNKFMRTDRKDNGLGVTITEYTTPHGILQLVPSWTLVNGWDGYALIVDTDNVKLLPFAGEDATLNRNIQANDSHGWTDEIYGSYTLEVRLPLTHFQLSGISG